MFGIEALRNIVHREVQRALDRRTRRTPCVIDSYDGATHRVKVKLQPEGTLSGWYQIETAQIGLLIAPNVGDPGWIEFHENDRRAGVFVASAHNNTKPPPKAVKAGELYYQNGAGQWVYVKSDGSIASADGSGASVTMKAGVLTAIDKANSQIELDGSGNATVGNAAGCSIVQGSDGNVSITGTVIKLNGNVWLNGQGFGANGSGAITLNAAVQVNGSLNVV